MKNLNLHIAKKEKNDKFYTQYANIKKEIQHYNLDYEFYNFVTYLKIMN